ncbi:MAG: hypothetical protein LBD27_01390 [Tannerella sp.]|nr:hypothetical protein [Tannerella sp.]
MNNNVIRLNGSRVRTRNDVRPSTQIRRGDAVETQGIASPQPQPQPQTSTPVPTYSGNPFGLSRSVEGLRPRRPASRRGCNPHLSPDLSPQGRGEAPQLGDIEPYFPPY